MIINSVCDELFLKFRGNSEITSFEEFEKFTGMTEVIGSAFRGNTNLNSVIIPPNVIKIGDDAFHDCGNLKSLGNSLHNIQSLATSAFQNCFALEGEFDLSSCYNFGSAVFADSRKIAKVTLSDSLTSIAGGLFSHCYNLEFVNIPTSLINIEGQAFRDCYSMKCPMTLPATLVSIGGAAFQGTSNIPYIKILAQTPPSLSYSVFWNCDYPIYVPDASVDAYKTAQGWSEYTSRIKPMSEFVE